MLHEQVLYNFDVAWHACQVETRDTIPGRTMNIATVVDEKLDHAQVTPMASVVQRCEVVDLLRIDQLLLPMLNQLLLSPNEILYVL